MRENEPRLSIVVCFVTYWMDLPIPGSPLVFPSPIPLPISPIPPSSEYKPTHIPLKGEGRCGGILASEVSLVEPTSLNRGEGLVANQWAWLEAERVRAKVVVERDGGGGRSEHQPLMWLMCD